LPDASQGGPWRLALPKGAIEKVQPKVRENFESALKALGDRAVVTRDVEWPNFPWGPAVGTIVGAEGASAFLELIESGGVKDLACPRDRYAGYGGVAVTAVDYLQAMRLRGPMKDAMNGLYAKFDAVVTPGRATVAYPVDIEFAKAWPGVSGGPPVIPAGNLCGLPALCLPTGLGDEGLPTSIAFMGPAFSEGTLVAIGRALQARTKAHTALPQGVDG